MKTTLYSSKGEKKSQIELPKIFETVVREDIVLKYVEADKLIQPYASDSEAGKKYSASGTISHKRHDWKGHYGRGISRIPRKTMWRRGTQFFWVGATAPSTRGGRRAHPPKGIGVEKKINKKEMKLAFASGFAATADPKYVVDRYETIQKVEAPSVIESLPAKTKDLKEVFKNIFSDSFSLVFKHKSVRAGKGTRRGRKYKSNAGLLVVTSSQESSRIKGVQMRSVREVQIGDLFPLGRLTLYTKDALKELGGSE